MFALLAWICATPGWLTPGMMKHKGEFWEAWEQRFGPINPSDPKTHPPTSVFKSWFRLWKVTRITAGDWIDANVKQPPPPSSML